MAKPFPEEMRHTNSKPFDVDFSHWQKAMKPRSHQRNYQHRSDRHRAQLDVNSFYLQGAHERPGSLFVNTLELKLYFFSPHELVTRAMYHEAMLAAVFAKATLRQSQCDPHQNMKKAMATKHQATIALYVKSLAC